MIVILTAIILIFVTAILILPIMSAVAVIVLSGLVVVGKNVLPQRHVLKACPGGHVLKDVFTPRHVLMAPSQDSWGAVVRIPDRQLNSLGR